MKRGTVDFKHLFLVRIKMRNVSLCIETLLKYPCSSIGIKMSIPFRAFLYRYFVCVYLVLAVVLLVIFAKLYTGCGQ